MRNTKSRFNHGVGATLVAQKEREAKASPTQTKLNPKLK